MLYSEVVVYTSGDGVELSEALLGVLRTDDPDCANCMITMKYVSNMLSIWKERNSIFHLNFTICTDKTKISYFLIMFVLMVSILSFLPVSVIFVVVTITTYLTNCSRCCFEIPTWHRQWHETVYRK